MVPHRRNGLGVRFFAAATTLLTGALLAGCGHQAELAGSTGEATGPSDSSVAGASGASTSRTGDHGSDNDVRTNRSSAQYSAASPSSEGTDSAVRTSTGRPPPDRRCHTAALEGSLEQGNPGAGQRYAKLTLRNTGHGTCTLYGYPGLELVDGSGDPLPTEVSRNADPGPATVRLAAHGTASTRLHWSVVPSGTDPAGSPCAPTPSGIRVTPPGEIESLRLAWQYGRVCGAGHIDVTALH